MPPFPYHLTHFQLPSLFIHPPSASALTHFLSLSFVGMTKSQAMGGVIDLRGSTSGTATTFVETDIHGFRDLVQKLTGLFHDPNSSTFLKRGVDMGPKKTAFKLRDRRRFQRRLEITSLEGSSSPTPTSSAILLNQGNLLSPTFPSPIFHSPITPLVPDPFASTNHSRSSSFSASVSLDLEGEGEFGFGDCPKREPELLPLFPLHSSNT